MVKMNHPVNWGSGLICSPAEAVERGFGIVETVDNFRPKASSKVRKATFVRLHGTSQCVEVSGYVRAAKIEKE